MSYTLITPQPANLEPGETAVLLETGLMVAVSVNAIWTTNNEGVFFDGKARYIDADGSSHVCGNGNFIQTRLGHTATMADVKELTQETISGAVLKAMLGEPVPTRVKDGVTIPIVAPHPEAADSINIRTAAAVASQTGQANAAAALGL